MAGCLYNHEQRARCLLTSACFFTKWWKNCVFISVNWKICLKNTVAWGKHMTVLLQSCSPINPPGSLGDFMCCAHWAISTDIVNIHLSHCAKGTERLSACGSPKQGHALVALTTWTPALDLPPVRTLTFNLIIIWIKYLHESEPNTMNSY